MMLAPDIPLPDACGLPTVYTAADVIHDGVPVHAGSDLKQTRESGPRNRSGHTGSATGSNHADRRRSQRSVTREINGRDRGHLPREFNGSLPCRPPLYATSRAWF